MNTDLKRDLAQMGRLLAMVVEHKHRIGFKGQILIEPKPGEPTKHQDDFDVAAVQGFLRAQRHVEGRYAGWDGERGRAILAGSLSLEDLAREVELRGPDPQPRSRRQERLEHRVASCV